ncbi:fimbrial protein [Cedecea sp.]|jgi:type 1 fimbria pilin|uniref:fimbrial protein n=1 Tax=Cedecea sp. TaxID=1970739 RepID=UPI002F3FFF5D
MRLLVGFAVALALLPVAVQSVEVVNVQGILLPPVCRVENVGGGDIHVDFGDDININRLNGSNYRKSVPYTVNCDKDGQQWPLRLRFEGSTNIWDSQALATSDPNLGIRLALSGVGVEFGIDIPVADSNNLPVMTAVPVRNAAVEPAEGQFTATANLLAEYY